MAKRKYKSIDEIPPDIRERLGQYITDVGSDTFVIHGLPPELTGGALARYSRAPTGIVLTLANEFLDDDGNPSQAKGTALMDRVLNAFGDESVGELEGTHAGLENVSQLATKFFEDRRIGGSPIEQSTRYVRYDEKDGQGRWRYLRPAEVDQAGLLPQFESTCDRAFDVYSRGIQKLSEYFRGVFPREQFQIEVERDGEKVSAGVDELRDSKEKRAFREAYNFTIRCAALDVGRCVLPASTLTHLGVFGNGRYFTNVLTFLRTVGLQEASERAVALRRELNKVIPTYVKRNRVDTRLQDVSKAMRQKADELFEGMQPQADHVWLEPRHSLLDTTVAHALYPYTNVSLQQIHEVVQRLPDEKKHEICAIYAQKRETRRDRVGRGLEAGYPLTFDLIGGFAEYRDLERHRMLTQQRQELTTDLGFIMPPEMGIIGLESEAEEVVGMFEVLHDDLRRAGLGPAAQYATLFNNRLRWSMGMNLRELQHLAELRTQPAGHFSYRSMVMEMVRQATERDPWISNFLQFVDYSDPGNKISRAKEQSRIAGKNLAAGIDGSVDYE
ncbi:hypothetical protein GF342_04945 [Candidatus Woesearchaeota archaeon]|nr:hypothetical protein [Candidatus Woesearchaeota archaeon]